MSEDHQPLCKQHSSEVTIHVYMRRTDIISHARKTQIQSEKQANACQNILEKSYWLRS